MLPVPFLVELHIREPEVRGEVDDQTAPRLEHAPYRFGALPVPVRDEGHIDQTALHLPRRQISPIHSKLRIDLANLPPRKPARRNPQSPNLGMPGEQPHELHPRVPTSAKDAHVQSHATHCRTSGYLFKFLYIQLTLPHADATICPCYE